MEAAEAPPPDDVELPQTNITLPPNWPGDNDNLSLCLVPLLVFQSSRKDVGETEGGAGVVEWEGGSKRKEVKMEEEQEG